MQKINRKIRELWITGCWLLVVGLLIYSRFVNLGWGLPYPMHPDERNMAVAVEQLRCKFPNSLQFSINYFRNCLNPHFFAYGQFPLYLGYIMIWFMKFFDGDLLSGISFSEAVISLRSISVVASVINFIIIIKIINLIINKQKNAYRLSPIACLLIVFAPYAVQSAHFGTTESLLMMLYSLTIFLSLRLIDDQKTDNDRHMNWELIFFLGLTNGLAVATKVSSIIFLVIPIVAIIYKSWIRSKVKGQSSVPGSKPKALILTLGFAFCVLTSALIFSPHNFISRREFVNTIRYESLVATGKIKVFYTRQFVDTVPILFQLKKIFPYALGWPVFILGLLGIFGLSWRNKRINLIRFAFFVYFIPNAFLFARWTRFMAPIFPIVTIFAILLLAKIKVVKAIKVIIIAISILPGIAYLSIYQNPDVRFQASEWIDHNVPDSAYILSETANVVDLPIENQKSKVKNQDYHLVSFDFYELDNSPKLQEELKEHLKSAGYIIVPSRRVFMNHTCNIKYQKSNIKNTNKTLSILDNDRCNKLEKNYPVLNRYYSDLFAGRLGFKLAAEFGLLADEEAEETWSVFDHPVIRIYKRDLKNKKSDIKNNSTNI